MKRVHALRGVVSSSTSFYRRRQLLDLRAVLTGFCCVHPCDHSCMVVLCVTGAAQDSVAHRKLSAAAELEAVRAIQELEEAAKRAAAAARHHYERMTAVWTGQVQQQQPTME